eukprot:CAMPEP_0168315754 /NCGR_PEP_ID=MMETSP0210-20121227/12595_1 /TAXON_ID=40633 /ORGANISM="Condylostoma magnum, Strain COL2" /LENGTH=106 /DNA_ID=CAMNT_0008291303 /DNA_START=4049 /DNA_END=4365 /DNA_ORIENTATION=+
MDPNETRLNVFDPSKIVTLSVLKLHREVHKRLNLEPGKYAIVPSTMDAGSVGEFWLSVYFSVSKRSIKLYKADEPDNKGSTIEEEEEITQDDITDGYVKMIQSLVT